MSRYTLDSRVVLITGATGGLGSALAMALRAKGARLALLDLDGAAVAQQAQALGGDAVARGWAVNVRDYDSVVAATEAAARHFGGIDVAIANAGVARMQPLASIAPADFEAVVDINLNGVWRTFRAALPHVQPRKGYLMAISSMAAFVHSPLQAPYTASKAGVWAMCDSVRLELRPYGVGVGSVHPTFFPTPMMDEVLNDRAGRMIWRGNRGGIWKMVTREQVVAAIVDGIERRRDSVIVPGRNTAIARAPGLFRRIIERIGFSDAEIDRMVRAAAGSADSP